MTDATLLIVGAGHEQVPAIRKAKAMGYLVAVTDRNPDAPGMALADHAAVISTADGPGTLAFARRIGIAGVMTLGSETAVPVVAHVAETLSLPGYSKATALAATNKNVMRRRFALFSVPTTESAHVRNVEEALAFIAQHGLPTVLKPSDSSGQRGTTRIDDPSAIRPAITDALAVASDGAAIIEKFHEGPEINVTAAVERGQITFLSLSERVTETRHFGIAIEHVAPPLLDEAARQAILDASEKAIRAVGLTDGIAYPQVLATTTGPKVLEIAVRIPGGHMDEVARHCSGIDMIEFSIRVAMGDPAPLAACTRHETSPALSVLFLTARDFPHAGRVIRSVGPLDAAKASPGVSLVRFTLGPGQTIPPLDHSASRFGAILARGATREEACARSRAAARAITLDIEPMPAGPAPDSPRLMPEPHPC